MTRDALNRQMSHIQDELLILGSMVEQAMISAVDTLKARNTAAARELFEQDQAINDKRFAIENAILILMATQQPMARDLRKLAAMLEVNTELERMGDYAKGIDKVTRRLGDVEVNMPTFEITKMAELSVNMLHRALTAFISENTSEALFNNAYTRIVNDMISHPETIDQVNSIMWVIHNIERMADRVTNICERTVFIATGELFDMDGMDEEDADM